MIYDMFHQSDNGNILVKKRERKPNSLFRLEEGYEITRLTNKIVYPKSSCVWKNYKQKSNRRFDRKLFLSPSADEALQIKTFSKKVLQRKKGYIVIQDDL